MAPKQSKMLALINYRLRVTLNDSRTLTGQMLAFDRHLNLVLADCEEFRFIKQKKRKGLSTGPTPDESEELEMKRALGLVILRGETIVSLSVEGPPPAVADEKGPMLAPGRGTGLPAGRGVGLAPPAGVPPPMMRGQPMPFSRPGGPPGAPPGLGMPPPGFNPGPGGYMGGPPPGFGAQGQGPPPGFPSGQQFPGPPGCVPS
ncbi:hypothetical protein DFH28DRAFT_1080021 [Melampsora americana]|nr:hypothetical protein DFH28DRAFT_1080021 [Melampsora americana]